jgi:hypothetical protein
MVYISVLFIKGDLMLYLLFATAFVMLLMFVTCCFHSSVLCIAALAGNFVLSSVFLT